MRTAELLELTTEGALQARLESVAHARRYREVKLGLLCAGRMAVATVRDSAEVAREAPPSTWLRTGCLTKLFTSALALQAVRRGQLRLDEDASARLRDALPAAASQLAGITPAHLLGHAHGLDDSVLNETPLLDNGRIDSRWLSRMIGSAPPLCGPGELYSYSHVGMLLLAVLLEQASGRTWHELLQEDLFAPLGLRHVPKCSRICPSRGYDLAVPLESMLAFAGQHGRAALHEDVPTTSLPGWHSSETGVRCGWKCYEAGWMGHNSEPPAAGAAVRVHPDKGIAIVIETGSDAPAPVLAAMFGRLLPDLVKVRFPPLLDAAACAALDMRRYVGEYENGSLRIVVTSPQPAVLELRAHRRHKNLLEDEAFLMSPLRPAQDGIFYLLPHSAHFAPFVQFTGEPGSGRRFLWNGRSVWPDIANRARS